MAKFGLIGRNIGYSFSKDFFTDKFEKEKRKSTYHIYDLANIAEIQDILEKNRDIKGLNVTTPYKESVIPYLDRIDKESTEIGAVNTIKFDKNKKLVGYNSDHYGFAKAISDFFPLKSKTVIILGTGGASKAIKYVLNAMKFKTIVVSRMKSNQTVDYNELDEDIIANHHLIINCTPLGTYPNIHEYPQIPYKYIGKDHLLFDLTYNPLITEFMEIGMIQGARVSNGYKMLEYQAEKSWLIWNS